MPLGWTSDHCADDLMMQVACEHWRAFEDEKEASGR